MLDTHPQGLALAAKSAGNKEEALNNMKFIKVIPPKQPKQKRKQFQATNLSAGLRLSVSGSTSWSHSGLDPNPTTTRASACHPILLQGRSLATAGGRAGET